MNLRAVISAPLSHVADRDASAAPEVPPRPSDPTHEPRVVLELVVEPILLGGETDEDPGRPWRVTMMGASAALRR